MLDAGGEYAWRVRGEEHMWTPDAIAKLQHSTRANKFDTYKEYAQIINDQSRRHMTLRGLFEFKVDPAKAIPLDEVEPAAEIVKRFATGAMSLGSISTEAHSTLAIAMNRIGGKSNTGEGGEDPARYRNELKGIPIAAGTKVSRRHRRQGHRGRLRDAGGRQPAQQDQAGGLGPLRRHHRVPGQRRPDPDQDGPGRQARRGRPAARRQGVDYIGFLRYSVPGVGLISPPPHHDIYSIEDLAQLIHDLKNANPRASISVKLVSEVGVGTIAAGVAKCKADHVVIAGHDGGTGASPWSASSTPARPGSWAWPRRSRPWCSTACAAASACRPTAR
jgi:glutamate synthase (NADPH) large chain